MKKIDEIFTEAGSRNHPNIICFISDWVTSFVVTRQEKELLETGMYKFVKHMRALRALYDLKAKIEKVIEEIKNEE